MLFVHVSATCTLLLNYGFQNVFYIHYCVTVLGIKAICHDYKDEPDCQFCHSNSFGEIICHIVNSTINTVAVIQMMCT